MTLSRILVLVGIPLGFIAAAVGLLKSVAVPFIGIWVLLGLAMVGVTVWLRPLRAGAALGFNLAAVCCALALAELYFWATDPRKLGVEEHREPAHSYRRLDAEIGFGPIPNTVLRVQRIHPKTREQLFDVRYTIGPNGLRVTGNEGPAGAAGCIWFFGDSFTFGHGLDDEQTLPYQLGVMSNGRYRTHNLAFSGYGPHQMLASLQMGHAAKCVDCDPDLVIFSGVPDGAHRAAGYAWYDPHGPRYALSGDGRAVFRGHFDDKTDFLGRLAAQLRKSTVWSTLVHKQLLRASSHAELYGAIVQASRDAVSEKYPRARFVVLFWNESASPIAPLIVADLLARGVALVLISEILDVDDRKYRLHAHDNHPSAAGNERIAGYLAPRLACIPQCGNDVR